MFMFRFLCIFFFFFFQAEDGIRDKLVTGVQTCALPIFVGRRSLGRDALVAVQTASALVLLVGAALLMRSVWQLSRVDAGYDTKGIFTFQVAAGRPDLNDRASVSRFQYVFMDRLKGLPGVESVGFISTLPLDEGAGRANVTTPRIQASGAG